MLEESKTIEPIIEQRSELLIVTHPAGDWIYNIKYDDAATRKEELKTFTFGPPRSSVKRSSANLSADNYIGVYFSKA